MISRNKAVFIMSLRIKKVREKEKLYVIEGEKLVKEFLMAGERVRTVVARPEFISALEPLLTDSHIEVITASFDELKKISSLKTPHNALATVAIADKPFEPADISGNFSVAIDSLQDPGNMGTIIRAAAWFGLKNIVCSPDCVDIHNPKVIQATMGAILHVNVFYMDLKKLLSRAKKEKLSVYGTFLEGDSIYDHTLNKAGIIIIGNESRGISAGLLPFITDKIKIPAVNPSGPGINSLNAGMAASIVFSEFSRKAVFQPNK